MATTISDRRLKLVTDLVTHRFLDHEEGKCQYHVQQAVRAMMDVYLCNAMFDQFALLDRLHSIGWTDEDIEWFGISDMFKEKEM